MEYMRAYTCMWNIHAQKETPLYARSEIYRGLRSVLSCYQTSAQKWQTAAKVQTNTFSEHVESKRFILLDQIQQ